ncbi:MAG: DUF4159 domain-containing protein [Gemmatimonadota bacterium]|nr:MAG: DUF4159 domain-containing protein [Gemmatimonadota bacterium]
MIVGTLRSGLSVLVLASGLTAGVVSATTAQETPRSRELRSLLEPSPSDYSQFNTPYDGRFTFARLMFTPLSSGGSFRRDLKWDHDYPRAERNFMRLLSEITTLDPYLDGGNVLAMDDPELFRYPVAYLSEPGYWTMTEAEEEGLRSYLLKGGFLIVDDFAGPDWYNFQLVVERLLPGHRIIPLDETHPMFDAFFHIESIEMAHPNYRGFWAQYFGVFEDNDPLGRPMMVINYNNDIGDYWEWSDTGWVPIEISNEAYKIGVNYIVYAMTH